MQSDDYDLDGAGNDSMQDDEPQKLGQLDDKEREIDAVIGEARQNMGPAEWWEEERGSHDEAESLRRNFEALEALGCTKLELYENLQRLHGLYDSPRRRLSQFVSQLEEHRARFDNFLNSLHTPVSVGADFTFDDWMQMLGLLGRYRGHVAQKATRLKTDPIGERQEKIVALLRCVRKRTGGYQYQLLADLLTIFVDPRLSEANLRQHVRRAGLGKEYPTEPKKLRTRKVEKGRKVQGSSRKAAETWVQAQIQVGNVRRKRSS